MEVRFTIKGNKEETTFSPINNDKGDIQLYAKTYKGRTFSFLYHLEIIRKFSN